MRLGEVRFAAEQPMDWGGADWGGPGSGGVGGALCSRLGEVGLAAEQPIHHAVRRLIPNPSQLE